MARKKIYLAFVVCIIFYVCYISIDIDENGLDYSWIFAPKISPESVNIICYDAPKEYNIIPTLIESSVPKNTSIFFVETSCGSAFPLNVRQACAIESVAKLNPESDVYLLIPSPIIRQQVEKFVTELVTYTNVKMRHIDMQSYFSNTPLERWYKSGRLKSSRWPESHASDILRYTTLWKFGGIYLDLDIILLKPFKHLMNFAGAESNTHVAAGFLSLSYQHILTNMTMIDLLYKFRGYDWGYNGPGVITRVLKKYCNESQITKMTEKRCHGFKVFDPSVFYPIPWKEWKDYFVQNSEDVTRVMNKLNESYAIHVWNYHSKKLDVTKGTSQPYSILASRFCPKVYSAVENTF